MTIQKSEEQNWPSLGSRSHAAIQTEN